MQSRAEEDGGTPIPKIRLREWQRGLSCFDWQENDGLLRS